MFTYYDGTENEEWQIINLSSWSSFRGTFDTSRRKLYVDFPKKDCISYSKKGHWLSAESMRCVIYRQYKLTNAIIKHC